MSLDSAAAAAAAGDAGDVGGALAGGGRRGLRRAKSDDEMSLLG